MSYIRDLYDQMVNYCQDTECPACEFLDENMECAACIPAKWPKEWKTAIQKAKEEIQEELDMKGEK